MKVVVLVQRTSLHLFRNVLPQAMNTGLSHTPSLYYPFF